MLTLNWDGLKPRSLLKESAVSCGVFDGVHRGHRALIKSITEKKPGLLSAAVTFKENPRRLLWPEKETRDIITLEKKISLLEELSLDVLVLIDFTLDFSRIRGEDFIKSLYENLRMRYLAIGEDFKCGAGGAADSKSISALCAKLGVEAEIVAPVLDGGHAISSSRIRAALAKGQTEEASRLLGWDYNV